MSKTRLDSNGMHWFDRKTGLNILLDEVAVPSSLWAAAPRFVSIAITNACDLHCEYCYAPKSAHTLPAEAIWRWADELDANGCLGIGLGGGEPTLHPRFFDMCERILDSTDLAVSVTTHLNRLSEPAIDRLSEVSSFVRVSMDGVGATYEKLRQRDFATFFKKLNYLGNRMRIGINFVVNDDTFGDLDAATQLASDIGIAEFALLPQVATASVEKLSTELIERLREWLCGYSGHLQLSISETSVPKGVSVANPFASSCDSYAHVDATGRLKFNSYETLGVQIVDSGFMSAYQQLCGEFK